MSFEPLIVAPVALPDALHEPVLDAAPAVYCGEVGTLDRAQSAVWRCCVRAAAGAGYEASVAMAPLRSSWRKVKPHDISPPLHPMHGK